jgi:uncharacterized protein YjbI with pentapeptide repeats
LPKCKFNTKYHDYESRTTANFNCDEQPLASGFCIFHDKDYLLQDKTNYEEHKRNVLDSLKNKVNHAISFNEPLLCIGFQLPDFSLSDLGIIGKEFTKAAYFNGSHFLDKADFSAAHFSAGASFLHAHFTARASFSNAIFQGRVSFFSSKFQGEAFFSGAKFEGEAEFSQTNFREKAYFSGVKFEGEAIFFETNFYKRADFFKGDFQEKADLYQARFEGEAEFSQTNFHIRVDFSETYFQEKVSFFRSKFQEEAIFFGANFQGEADFSVTNFQGEADFYHSLFYGKTYFSGQFNSKTKFNYISFEGKEKVIFDIENLSNVSFMNTDLTGVRFSDRARWGEENTKEDRFKIVDERLLEEKIKRKKWNKKKNIKPSIENVPAIQEDEKKDGDTSKDFNLGSIKAVYRNLRENYEYRMRYDEAGQFFIREMELKRKYREVVSSKEDGFEVKVKQNNWFRRNFSLTGLYYNLFVYGEDLKRPALILLLPLFILSTLYWGAIDPSSSSIKDSFARWFNATERTVFNMSQIGIQDPEPVDTTIKTASLAILGTLLIPLRRKFERKFRH